MNLPRVDTKTIMLSGGLDLETPLMAVGEGYALEAENFEPNLMAGYRKMQGHERLDGRARPSDAVYHTLPVTDSSSIVVGESITGDTSGATAEIIIKDDDRNLLGITDLSGDFTADEDFTTDTGSGTTTATQIENNYPDTRISAQWNKAAQDYYRDKIQPVPGSGPVLGVWHWNGKKYAFRSDGSNVLMYESSGTGWQAITFYSLLKFTDGTFNEGGLEAGDTITGATSSATATVKRVVKVSGSYGADAVGYLVIDVTSGTFQDGENLQESAATIMVADGADEPIELASDGNRYEFVNYNFGGSSDTYYMYGCDGTNPAFEWDGELYTPILTGMEEDAPGHIEIHSNHLFLTFPGGSLQNSATREPLVFNPILGAAELGVGEEIRSINSVTGDAMLIATDRGVWGLYGTDVDNFQLQRISTDGGDIGSTLDVMGNPMMLTQRGIQRVAAGDIYGNFESATLSRRINPFLAQKLRLAGVVGSNVVRNKNQYRIYFDDGTGLILAQDQLFGGESLPEFTTFTLGFMPTCVESVSITSAEETILAGGTDGYVYELERGNSLDGEEMIYVLRLPFHHLGRPQVRKAFRWLDIESDVPETADLRVSYEFSDGASHTRTSPLRFYEFTGNSRAYWGEAFWGEFNWSDEVVSRESLSLSGTGHNISVLFYGASATASPFTINSITYQYIPRRLRRAS